VVDARAVAAAIRAHDAQVSSVEVEYMVDIGIGNGPPRGAMAGWWAADGEHEALTAGEPGQPPRTRSASDGKTVRGLDLSDPAHPTATVSPAAYGSFARGNELPRGASARWVWEHSLLSALDTGKVSVVPAIVNYDGARCYELFGPIPGEGLGAAGPGFRALLDADRGCMPRYLEEYVADADGQPASRVILDQYSLAEVKPGIWHPTALRQQALLRNAKGGWETATINRVRYPQIRVNGQIPADRMVVRFPKGAVVEEIGERGLPEVSRRTVETDETDGRE
jgi:hypothetical protein